jgi:hypothetical protein
MNLPTDILKSATNLGDLIGLCHPTFRLEIDNFLDSAKTENAVATADSFRKTKSSQQVAKIIKRNVCIGLTEQNLFPQLVPFAHSLTIRLTQPSWFL